MLLAGGAPSGTGHDEEVDARTAVAGTGRDAGELGPKGPDSGRKLTARDLHGGPLGRHHEARPGAARKKQVHRRAVRVRDRDPERRPCRNHGTARGLLDRDGLLEHANDRLRGDDRADRLLLPGRELGLRVRCREPEGRVELRVRWGARQNSLKIGQLTRHVVEPWILRARQGEISPPVAVVQRDRMRIYDEPEVLHRFPLAVPGPCPFHGESKNQRVPTKTPEWTGGRVRCRSRGELILAAGTFRLPTL